LGLAIAGAGWAITVAAYTAPDRLWRNALFLGNPVTTVTAVTTVTTGTRGTTVTGYCAPGFWGCPAVLTPCKNTIHTLSVTSGTLVTVVTGNRGVGLIAGDAPPAGLGAKAALPGAKGRLKRRVIVIKFHLILRLGVGDTGRWQLSQHDLEDKAS
jgi:hypothetical protein